MTTILITTNRYLLMFTPSKLFRLWLILLFASTAGSAVAQSRIRRAEDAMQQYDYITAIQLCQQILEDDDDPDAKMYLAEAYRKINDTENAEYWFGQVVRLPQAKALHKLYYGMMLQANGKCDLAKIWFVQYQKEAPDDARGQYLVRSCDLRDELMQKNKGIYTISHLPFNSKYDDYAPAIQNSKLIFASDRETGTAIKRTNMWTGNPFSQLYAVPFQVVGLHPGDYRYGLTLKFSKNINSRFHEAAVAFSPDQKTIYFTRNNFFNGKKGTSDEGLVKLKIYTGKSDGKGGWEITGGLPFNSDEYNVAHPTVSEDGQRMFFSSNRPGGFGGMDLYMSQLQGNTWGPPINLGPVVNTEGNEIFPYISSSGRLYFSSNGHIGLGGLDLFYTTPANGADWNLPVNLGAPVNSGNDDFAITFGPGEEWGFFSSDRDGGVGGDDIYSFQKSASPIEILVVDQQTQLPVSGAVVSNSLTRVNMTTGDDGKIAFDMRFTDCADFSVTKKGYESALQNACATAQHPGDISRIMIPIQKQANYQVQGIVFDMMNGLPAEGAQVMLMNDCGKPLPNMVTTMGDGRFRFKLDKDCCYTIRAVKDGYITDVKEEICTRGVAKNTVLKANLTLQPYRDEEGFAIVPGEKSNTQKGPRLNRKTGLYENANGTPASFDLGEGLQVLEGVLFDHGEKSKPNESDVWERGSMGYIVNIYYGLDQEYFLNESLPDLEKLLRTLRETPELQVEIASHTDSRGSDAYNLDLSQRRADRVVHWLVQQGISRDRLTAKGYGESRLVNACDNNSNCSEEEHRLNRRTEFRITGILKTAAQPASSIPKPKPGACVGCPF